MKTKSLHRILLLILSICILSGVVAYAYSSNSITISLRKQESDNWCWAACSEACIKYYFPTSNVTQTSLVQYVNPSPYGANADEVKYGLEYYGVSSDYYSGYFVWDSTYVPSVVQEIDAGRPIIAQTMTLNGTTSHDVLVQGYYTGPSAHYVGYKNPWPVGTGYSNTVYACNFDTYGQFYFLDSSTNINYFNVGTFYSID